MAGELKGISVGGRRRSGENFIEQIISSSATNTGALLLRRRLDRGRDETRGGISKNNPFAPTTDHHHRPSPVFPELCVFVVVLLVLLVGLREDTSGSESGNYGSRSSAEDQELELEQWRIEKITPLPPPLALHPQLLLLHLTQ